MAHRLIDRPWFDTEYEARLCPIMRDGSDEPISRRNDKITVPTVN